MQAGSADGSVSQLTSRSVAVNGHRPEAVEHLRRQLKAGRFWADALLEAVGLWTAPQEEYQERHFTYLVQDEAFDWLLVAERLLIEVPEAVPDVERERLLFHGELPAHVTEQYLKRCLGVEKYRGHLNFFYGVVVEEELMQAVELEALKEGRSRGFTQGRGVDEQVAQRLYGDTYGSLLQRFQGEDGPRLLSAHGEPFGSAQDMPVEPRRTLSLGEWKAFVYWLHKLRLKRSDQARTASDTRKGLRQLRLDAAAHVRWPLERPA